MQTSSNSGYYFRFERGEWFKPNQETNTKFYPASGLVYAGSLTEKQYKELNQMIDDFFDNIKEQTKPEPLTADDLKEPKNGKQWHVEWWNESCRMMLPSGSKLDSFHSYKNGTLQFTIKKTDKSIKE